MMTTTKKWAKEIKWQNICCNSAIVICSFLFWEPEVPLHGIRAHKRCDWVLIKSVWETEDQQIFCSTLKGWIHVQQNFSIIKGSSETTLQQHQPNGCHSRCSADKDDASNLLLFINKHSKTLLTAESVAFVLISPLGFSPSLSFSLDGSFSLWGHRSCHLTHHCHHHCYHCVCVCYFSGLPVSKASNTSISLVLLLKDPKPVFHTSKDNPPTVLVEQLNQYMLMSSIL